MAVACSVVADGGVVALLLRLVRRAVSQGQVYVVVQAIDPPSLVAGLGVTG